MPSEAACLGPCGKSPLARPAVRQLSQLGPAYDTVPPLYLRYCHKMFGDLLSYMAGEWEMLSQAPLSFVLVVTIAGLVGWWLGRSAYAGQIRLFERLLSRKDEEVKAFERMLNADSPSDAVFKIGQLSAMVDALSVGKWPPLNHDQIEKARQELGKLRVSKVQLQMTDDARALTIQFAGIFEDLGWDVEGLQLHEGAIGITVGPKIIEEAKNLAAAIRAIGLEVQLSDRQMGKGGRVSIQFGSRPFHDDPSFETSPDPQLRKIVSNLIPPAEKQD